MDKGYKYSAIGAGVILLAGFFLPWFSVDRFNLSGFTIAGSGYSSLLLMPAAALFVIFKSMTGSRQRASYLLYPCMAEVLALVSLVSSVFFSDSGLLKIENSVNSTVLSFMNGQSKLIFNPLQNTGIGLILILTGIIILLSLPLFYKKIFEKKKKIGSLSYKNVIRDPEIVFEYKRFSLFLISLTVLTVTYIWCGISPYKIWENRGNAREYLFGRKMSQNDLDYIDEQKKRAPQIEALGKAEEYMANKYRVIPLSEQPGYQEKSFERKALTEKFLQNMSEERKAELRKEAGENAIIEKKGGYFPPETSLIKIKAYIVALIETLAIAIWGTLLSVLVAVPVSFLAAKNTLKLIISSEDMKSIALRKSITFFIRRCLDSCRGFNEFVMALIFVAVIGLGPYAGILALWIHTFGILGKVFSEQIEAIESGQMEALVSTGASAVQTIAFSVMPQVLPGFVSYILLRFESNVRSAAILGFVGAGGIGFLIFDKLNGYLFREVCTMMIIIIITVGIIDLVCSKIRTKFI